MQQAECETFFKMPHQMPNQIEKVSIMQPSIDFQFTKMDNMVR